MDKPTKKGRVAKTDEGKLVLVNDINQAYIVDQSIISVWNMLDGTKTVNDVTQDIAQRIDAKPEQLAPQINATVEKLKELGLII
ncbi:MAG: PqqD family protein [Candidatus Heimdallarchaeota archaeon]